MLTEKQYLALIKIFVKTATESDIKEIMDSIIKTDLIGTYRDDIEVGKIYTNIPLTNYGINSTISIKILREVTEKEYREYHNYYGNLPDGSYGRKARFFEAIALD